MNSAIPNRNESHPPNAVMNNDDNTNDHNMEMIPCSACGHWVPRMNMAIHQAHACRSSSRSSTTPTTTSRSDTPQIIVPSVPVVQGQVIATNHPDNNVIDLTQENTPVAAAAAAAAAPSRSCSNRRRMMYDELDDNDDTEEMEDSKIPAQTSSSSSPPRHSSTATAMEVDDEEPSSSEWACPRCTLLNSITSRVCDACQFWNPNPIPPVNDEDDYAAATTTPSIRSPDPVRTERLIPDHHHHPDHDPYAPFRFVSGGAVLGGMLGATGAYLRGEPISHSAVSGALSGAMGGALLQSFTYNNNNNNNNNNTTTNNHHGNGNCSRTTATTTNTTTNQPPMNPTRTTTTVRSTGDGGIQRTTVRRGPFGSTIITYSSYGGDDTQMMPMMMDPMDIWRHMFLANSGQRLPGHPTMSAVDGMSYDQLLQLFGDGTEHLGADEATIRRMPVSIVDHELPEECRECRICLEPFQTSEQRMILPCLHGFHKACAEKWLRTNASCPVCKHKIQQEGNDQS